MDSIELEHRLTEGEAQIKANTERLDLVEKRQDDLEDLVITVKELALREERVEDDVKEIKTDVKSLTGKSGKRWENLMSQIITILVAAIVGFFLAQIGM